MAFIVGLTGGIGSGKTQVADRLAELGVHVIDADVVAREVVEPGTDALASIAQHFGYHLLDQDGRLKRDRLRQIIFSDKQAKTWLEKLLHPLIGASIKTQLAQINSPYGLLVSPLLLETEQNKLVDKIIVVDADPSQQLARAINRDVTNLAEVEAIMAAQMSRNKRLSKADIILDNTRDLISLHNKVDQLHQHLTTLAEDFNA